MAKIMAEREDMSLNPSLVSLCERMTLHIERGILLTSSIPYFKSCFLIYSSISLLPTVFIMYIIADLMPQNKNFYAIIQSLFICSSFACHKIRL